MEFRVLSLVAWLMSGAVTTLIGAVAITYVRRTSQLIRADEDESAQERILDGIDELQVRLYGIQERLTELDERLGTLERRLPEGVFLARLAAPVAEDGPGVAGGGSAESGVDG